MEELLKSTGEDTGTTIDKQDDKFGYRWMVLTDPDFEDLVVGVNASPARSRPEATATGCWRRCSASATRTTSPSTGSTTTSAARSTRSCRPAESSSATPSASCSLKAQIGAELPVEAQLERWFPLWDIPI